MPPCSRCDSTDRVLFVVDANAAGFAYQWTEPICGPCLSRTIHLDDEWARAVAMAAHLKRLRDERNARRRDQYQSRGKSDNDAWGIIARSKRCESCGDEVPTPTLRLNRAADGRVEAWCRGCDGGHGDGSGCARSKRCERCGDEVSIRFIQTDADGRGEAWCRGCDDDAGSVSIVGILSLLLWPVALMLKAARIIDHRDRGECDPIDDPNGECRYRPLGARCPICCHPSLDEPDLPTVHGDGPHYCPKECNANRPLQIDGESWSDHYSAWLIVGSCVKCGFKAGMVPRVRRLRR